VKPFLFVTDLDHTLVGNDRAMHDLNQQLEHHRQQYGTKVVYSTGRSLTSYSQLLTEKPLLPPDILICAVGTEIYHQGSGDPDHIWSQKLAHGWDREQIITSAARFLDLKPQPDSEQRPFKVSYFLNEQAAIEVIPDLEALFEDQGLDVQLIFSGGKDLDILPQQANKGMAMAFVRQFLEFEPMHTVACGDSGNDVALFRDRPERGIIVGNARPELLQWHKANPNPNRYLALADCAAGILEGLQHFGFL